MRTHAVGLVACLSLVGALALAESDSRATVNAPDVRVVRLPDGGLQPQVMKAANGDVLVVYFKGDPRQGDVYLMRSEDDGASFSDPLRVNSQAGGATVSVDAALGASDRVHVVWHGSHLAEPKAPGNTTPVLYARLNDAGDAFETQRNIISARGHVDGGSAVAADDDGNVYVVWHAPKEGGHGEQDRRVWVASSTDDGATFDAEVAADPNPAGACACCALSAHADSAGALHIMYRTAWKVVNRDMYHLVSSDGGESFRSATIDKWNIGACMMSTSSFAPFQDMTLMAWETKSQVHFGPVDAGAGGVADKVTATGQGRLRKNPVLAAGSGDTVLLAWTQGVMMGMAGRAEWQIYDAKSNALLEAPGSADGVPGFGALAAFSTDDGFIIIY